MRVTGKHRSPAFARYRTIEGFYGLHITCWHGAVGAIEYPDRATVASWEAYASLNPCSWVPACPDFEWHLKSEERFKQWQGKDYQDLVPPYRRKKAKK